jgi:lysozyme
MNISQDCLELIKKWEGFRPKPYLCSAGVPTIGFGSTFLADGTKVTLKTPAISKEAAEMLLASTACEFALKVDKLIKVKVTQSQFDAMVCFAYNMGVGAFSGSSILKFVNAGEFKKAADSFLLWNKEKDPQTKKLVESKGLTNRRIEEKSLFERGMSK